MINKFIAFLFSLTVIVSCDKPASEKQQQFSQPFSQMLVYPKKNRIEPFKLSAHDQTIFDASAFQGYWNLIFMGYTHCPDVCPTTLLDLNRIYEKISPEYQRKFRIIFLSVDPGRDSLQHLSGYISHFNDRFIAVTGQKKQIDSLVLSLGGIYTQNKENEAYYSVDHSSRIFIVNPAGERYGMITSEAMHNKDKSRLISELNQLALLKK